MYELVTDREAVLYRTIARGHVESGVVLWAAFMPSSIDRGVLSTDQALLSTPRQSFRRRATTPHSVRSVLVKDVEDVAKYLDSVFPVIDDHIPGDLLMEAHASVDMTAATKSQRRDAAARLLGKSQHVTL